MNTYRCSDGTRLSQSQIETRIRVAKSNLIKNQLEQYGYNFCEDCKQNDCKPIDCSHNISVKEAKETGRTELCFSLSNLKLRGRKCHQIKDGLNIQNGY